MNTEKFSKEFGEGITGDTFPCIGDGGDDVFSLLRQTDFDVTLGSIFDCVADEIRNDFFDTHGVCHHFGEVGAWGIENEFEIFGRCETVIFFCKLGDK